MSAGVPNERLSVAQRGVEALLWQVRHAAPELPEAEREYRFHPERKWRFDLAWPGLMLAAEVDGGAWVGGRHATGRGIEADSEKVSTAVAMGWRVLRFTPRMIDDGRALSLTLAALHWRAP